MNGFAVFIVRHRHMVLMMALLVTVFLAMQLRHLNVIVDADELLPREHPFVHVTERVEALFGNRYTVVIGVSPETGDVYTPETLGKVVAITQGLAATPGVMSSNLQSLAARRAKDIVGTEEGLQVSRLLEHAPADIAAARQVEQRLAANPVYRNVLVSEDGGTAAIYAEFQRDPAGFGEIMRKVNAVIDPLRDDSVRIAVAGQPVFLEALESFSRRMALLLPLAIIIIGLLHMEAFRTVQALLLPLLTAVLAVVWALGIMTLAGVHLDPFNNATPILILAVAAGHAVQVLKRYYEEYNLLRGQPGMDPAEANRQAVVRSIIKVGPVMLAAGSIAALSFMSLVIFDIQSIRTFGIFAGIGILSVLIVELTFTPALRAMLPPPSARECRAEKSETVWDKVARGLAGLVVSRHGRRKIFIAVGVAMTVCLLGITQVRVDNSLRGFFGEGQQVRVDDRHLNQALAGSNTFYVLVEGRHEDAIKDPDVLRGMEATQAMLAGEPEVGRSISIVDMLKQINQALNEGDPAAYVLPDSMETIAQYLFLYSISGEPGDFDGLVDYPYRTAIIQAFVKTDSSAYVAGLHERILPFIEANFPDSVDVRLGGSITTPTAMNEVMVDGKLWNILQICLVVFLISSMLFRSPLLGALILIPLSATVMFVFGIMGLSGIPMQIATATVSALAIGIGADYAIYLSYRLREELSQHEDIASAVHATFTSAGKAVMFVASAVAGGYSVLMLSIGFNIHFWLGLLTASAMVIAAISTLTLFASLLVVFKPKVVFGRHRQAATPTHPASAPVPGAAALPLLAIACLLLTTAPVPVQADAVQVDPAVLMADSLRATKVLRSSAQARFVLTNASGQQRVRETVSLSEVKPGSEDNRRVVRFEAPADIRGTTVLTVENGVLEDDIWVYLPAMRRVRRLSASNKKDAFVGTDFTYGDVLGHAVEHWTHRALDDDQINGTAVHVIESIPRDATVAADSGYSRRVSWIRHGDAVLLKSEFHDLAGELLKVYSAEDIQLVDADAGRHQPMQQTMHNVQTGHSTVISYTRFDTDTEIPEQQFTSRALERPLLVRP